MTQEEYLKTFGPELTDPTVMVAVSVLASEFVSQEFCLKIIDEGFRQVGLKAMEKIS